MAELAGASGLAVRKRMNHRAARAVGQGLKCAIQTRCISHSQMAIYWLDREGKVVLADARWWGRLTVCSYECAP